MNTSDPIVLELEARLAEAVSLGSEATLTEIRARALAALEPMFAERFANRIEPAFPTAAEHLRGEAVNLRKNAVVLPQRKPTEEAA